MKGEASPRFSDAAVLAAALVLAAFTFWFAYFPRTALTVQQSDGAEFALAAVRGSLAHPPGYPLYSWLAEFLVKLFPSNPYHALAGFSAFCQAVTVGALVIVLFQLSGSFVLSLALSIAWGLYEPSIRTATDAEVFALHHLLVVVAVGLALNFSRSQRFSRCHAVMLGAALGLAVAHQHLLVLFLPLIVGVIWARTNKTAQCLARIFVPAVLVAFVLYLSLFLRYWHAPRLAFAPLVSVVDFLTYLLRGGYGTFSLVLEGSHTPSSFGGVILSGLLSGMPVALLLSLFILPLALLRRNAILIGTLVTLICTFLFARELVVPDSDSQLGEWVARFYPSIALTLVFAASISFSYLKSWRSGAALSLALVSVVVVWVRLPEALQNADRSKNLAVDREVSAILEQAPPNSVVLVASDWLVFGLNFKQAAFGQRPDLTLITVGKLESEFYRQALLKEFDGQAAVNQESLKGLANVMRLVSKSNRPVVAERRLEVPPGLVSERQGVLAVWTLPQP